MKKFVSPQKNYKIGKFKTSSRPHSPSPKRMNYESKAKKSSDKITRCTFIHPDTSRRCKNKLGIYPEFCYLHTLSIQNLYIHPSNIPRAGNGLFAGPFGFKKGDIIGRYSEKWNSVNLGTLEKRCTDENCWSYVYCNDIKYTKHKTKCWDALDIRSTIMRNINDAHGSNFKNNSAFDNIKGNIYVVATKNIKPKSEIFVSYGSHYWN
jgi:uncharacterized protein YifE (UPF0438 family)